MQKWKKRRPLEECREEGGGFNSESEMGYQN